ncbi:MAG TPA: hypothetical protein VG961_13710 [Ignavibacteria bacterium]|nr:hypothetical protein [Ignavibacteria bacterium]
MASSYKITGDDDFFWHLATGRYIIENKTIPDKDVFGHTTEGSEWIPFEWGWDVVSFSLYNIGGYSAVMIFRSILIMIIFLIYFVLLKKFKVNTIISLLMLTLLLASMMDRLSPRPHVFTYLFFTIILYICLSFKYFDRDSNIKKLSFLPLIFLIWCNFHMGVLAGGLFLFIFVLSETIIFLKPKSLTTKEILPLTKKHLIKLFMISVLCALALLVNPHGLQTYLYAYSHTKLTLLNNVNEWQSPFTSKFDFGFIVTLYKVYLVLGIFVLAYAFKKRDLFFALIFAAFAIYSVRAIRFTVDYEIILTFFIAMSISFFLKYFFKNKSVIFAFLNGNIAKVLLAAIFIFMIIQMPNNNIYKSLQYYRYFGWGLNDEFLPVQLFDFMKENKITGKPYNHFGTGGYLIWNFPGEKNFIDSRNLNDDIYNKYNAVMTMSNGFENILNENGIDYVIYLDPDLTKRTDVLKKVIVKYLSTNPNWKLVFWDDKSMLFVKDLPKFSELINHYQYKVLQPYLALFSVAEYRTNVLNFPNAVKSELDRKMKTEPNGVLWKGLQEMTNNILKTIN